MKNKFYTKTLALLYAKQGYYEEAENGFKSLLVIKPGDSDCCDALSAIGEKKKERQKKDLVDLVSEWVGFLKQERLLKG